MNEGIGPSLRQWTSARVALGRSGGSAPYRSVLDFRLSHALARDAVRDDFDPSFLMGKLGEMTIPFLLASSQAADRGTYLQRPDLGRTLTAQSARALAAASDPGGSDLVIILADGLSATAAHLQGLPLLRALLPLLGSWTLAPIVIASFARVALQDEIGAALGARAALILLGERPGLGSPDSLGAYLVHGPRSGNTDARRNCVSNIRPAGLPPESAARRIFWLLQESRRLGFSGVDLKDNSERAAVSSDQATLGSPSDLDRESRQDKLES